ncbi:sodium-dependent bicarbonate transport family permease [Marinobacterium marinum]|uniref:Sodium-dependent bicarbonate transport family permease n=1 Tax=Marinobacterium marinum TaxID=2756129 RepID=A0A7W1WVZ6_9GAMM|nr:sodium-dependent bicarbonate transport family permease [Marinobacterium marinum]MBA4501245.1 sodium-dependent bicarbonate transport family permease [Marinobacterium marinum]
MPDIVAMFFLLGVVAGLVKSDLNVPKAAYDTLSLLLMLTIGLKGGMGLHGNLTLSLVPELLLVLSLGAIIPLLLFPLLRKLVRLSLADSASICAHYGSVSAGTFAVALAYTESHSLITGPEVTLYLVLLELPAIMVGLALFRHFDHSPGTGHSRTSLLHETLTNRSVVLLAGGVVIGYLYGPMNGASVTDLFTGAFKAVLALFLLEMGLTAAETLRPIPWKHWRLLTFACVTPSLLACFGIAAGLILELPQGTTLVLASLTASASYIAVPAAMRAAVPQANIGLAMLASLGLTFPFNVIFGIPLYHQLLLSLGV